jgi:hypothetical protein
MKSKFEKLDSRMRCLVAMHLSQLFRSLPKGNNVVKSETDLFTPPRIHASRNGILRSIDSTKFLCSSENLDESDNLRT